eukprot:CAMPEP_0176476164 /NCGR_PEP_ID=MMETSP0127-20121128/43997_1 /TAXON_ID=938130 /ORGANISM="Platyophrya macrostoma, Strain WH" /LENGTH=277 /DNA_ID=CAMNT_0017871815 /DNA_START=26 /DNA_END=862 /DNA_ORIENTATION=-
MSNFYPGGWNVNQPSLQNIPGINPTSMPNYMPGTEGESFNYSYYQDPAQQENVKKLREKYAVMKAEIEKLDKNPEIYKVQQLPLARIKKIMKSDEDVRMISAEAPVLFAKACEMFIIELTHRSWLHTEEGKRRTLQKNDIATCIANTDIFDFLVDTIPREVYNKNMTLKKPSSDTFLPFNVQGGMNYQMPPTMSMGVNPQAGGASLNAIKGDMGGNPNSQMFQNFMMGGQPGGGMNPQIGSMGMKPQGMGGPNMMGGFDPQGDKQDPRLAKNPNANF